MGMNVVKTTNCAGCTASVIVGLLGPFRWDAYLWRRKTKYSYKGGDPIHVNMHEKFVCQACYTQMSNCAIGIENGTKKCKFCSGDLPKAGIELYPCGRKK